MNWKNIQVLFIALTIFTTMFIITSGEAFQIEPDLPDPATEDIWFRPLGTVPHDYRYYYSGNVGFHSWVDNYDIYEDEYYAYEWPVDFQTIFGTNTEVLNSITYVIG